MKNLVTALVLATSFAAFAQDVKPATTEAKAAPASTKHSSSKHSKKAATPAKPAADKPADAPAK